MMETQIYGSEHLQVIIGKKIKKSKTFYLTPIHLTVILVILYEYGVIT